MAQVSDFVLDNQGFSSFRTELNNILSAQNSNNSGTSRPSSATTGTIWLDTTNSGSNSLTLKFFDGSDDISLANIDTSANTVNWLDSSVTTELVNDTSPQLGGNLDTNSHNIAFDDAHGINDENGNEQIIFQTTSSAVNQLDITNAATGNAPEISATGGDTNIDLKLTPKGSGKLNLDGIKFPNADGTANQALITDGSGNLSFGAVSGGGVSWQSTIKTGTFTASDGEGYFCNTTSSAFTVNLPSGSAGAIVAVKDYAGTFASNNLTISANGSDKIGGSTDDVTLLTGGLAVTLVFADSTRGWLVTDDGLQSSAPQVYQVDFLCIAGGGGAGIDRGGGGGAGGYRNSFSSETSGGGGSSETALNFTPGNTYTITIGGGGTGSVEGGSLGSNGEDSSISGTGITTTTSAGGGRGGQGGGNSPQAGSDGGSGGGSGTNPGAAGNGTSDQGFAGGSGGAGGGGGAAEAGNTDGSGHGGDGLDSSITASAVTRGGGGGGSLDHPNSAPPGGAGGGGTGAVSGSSRVAPTAGSANTGGGGGGGTGAPPARHGANGGSGVVILRMATSNYSGTTSGSPTVTTSGSDTILTFNASGSYTA